MSRQTKVTEIKNHALRTVKPVYLVGSEMPADFDIKRVVGRATICAQSPDWFVAAGGGIDNGVQPDLIVLGNRADVSCNADRWIELIRRSRGKATLVFMDKNIANYVVSPEDLRGSRLVGVEDIIHTNPHFFDDDPKVFENPPLWFAIKITSMLRHTPVIVFSQNDASQQTAEAEDDGTDVFGTRFLHQWKEGEAEEIRRILPRIVLITQFQRTDKRRRQQELRKCLRKNLENPLIDSVVLLNDESLTDTEITDGGSWLDHAKLVKRNIGHRLTYEAAWRQARDELDDNCIVILANADIYFEDSIRNLFAIRMRDERHLLALLRYEEATIEGAKHQLFGPRPDSQDAWIFHSHIPDTLDLKTLAIPLGVAGCDNAVLAKLKDGGQNMSNPAGNIHAIHVHASGQRTWKNNAPIPSSEYVIIPPTQLGDFNVVSDITPWVDRITCPEDEWELPTPVANHEITTQMNYVKQNLGMDVVGEKNYVVGADNIPALQKFARTYVGPAGIMQSLKDNTSFGYSGVYAGQDIRILSEVVAGQAVFNPLQPGYDTYDGFMLQILPKIMWWSQQPESKNVPALSPFGDEIASVQKSLDMHGMSVSVQRKESNYYNQHVYHTEALKREHVSRDQLRLLRENLRPEWKQLREQGGRVCVVVCDGEVFGDAERANLLVTAVRTARPDWKIVAIANDTSVLKSRRAFAQAHTVISQSSPHLGNTIYCPDGCRIIQAQQEEKPNVLYWMAATALGHPFALMPVKREPPARQAAVIGMEIEGVLERLGEPSIVALEFDNNDPVAESGAENNADGAAGAAEGGAADDADDFQDSLFVKKGEEAVVEGVTVDKIVLPKEISTLGLCEGEGLLELIGAWEKQGLVTVDTNGSVAGAIWIGNVGGTLLAHWNSGDDVAKGINASRIVCTGHVGDDGLAWSYYSSHPVVTEEWGRRERVPQADRTYGAVFTGAARNRDSMVNRTRKNWSSVCDEFNLVFGEADQKQSLEDQHMLLRSARWGLLLRGHGDKSGRMVDLLAHGTPLLVTPNVDLRMFEDLKEGVHQRVVETPDDVMAMTAVVGEDEWESMSRACRDYWERRMSVQGAYDTLVERLA